jgi:hypothetical protein
MARMDNEIIPPASEPKIVSRQAFSPIGCFLAAAGATFSTLFLLGSGAAAGAWALGKLMGLPDTAIYMMIAVALLPVIWATVWTAGRAWHVERRLAAGQDVDVPVFKLAHYFKAT